MNEPNVVVKVADIEGKHTIAIVCEGGAGLLNTVQWNLEDVEKEGYLGLCEKLGNATMVLLAQEHAELFEKYPMLKPPESFLTNPVHMVLELMDLSRKFRTKAYASALDDLFHRYPDELGKTNLPNIWATVKEDFLKFSG